LRALAWLAVIILCYLVNRIGTTMPFLYVGGFTLVEVAVAVLLVSLAVAPVRPLLWMLRLAPLVWFGRISYGLYLWHWIVNWYERKLPGSLGVKALLGVGLSVALAALSFYLVERPFLRLKKRFTPTRRAGQG
jgi:peptidoglycan/LPS O-acetylase OafA/YrhL